MGEQHLLPCPICKNRLLAQLFPLNGAYKDFPVEPRVGRPGKAFVSLIGLRLLVSVWYLLDG